MNRRGGNTTLRVGVTPRSLTKLWFRTEVILPDELKDKSPQEVAAYYQNLIQTQKNTYEAALESFNTAPPPTPSVAPPEPKVTMQDFLNDPTKHTKDLINKNSVSREEFNAATKQVQQALVWTAEQQAIQKLKADVEKLGGTFEWDRWKPQIQKVIDSSEPFARVSPDLWVTSYYYIVGSNAPTMVKEAVTKATMPMEPTMPGGNEPPTPVALTSEQKVVAEGLGLTEDSYRKGTTHMKANKFPLTTDNRNRR